MYDAYEEYYRPGGGGIRPPTGGDSESGPLKLWEWILVIVAVAAVPITIIIVCLVQRYRRKRRKQMTTSNPAPSYYFGTNVRLHARETPHAVHGPVTQPPGAPYPMNMQPCSCAANPSNVNVGIKDAPPPYEYVTSLDNKEQKHAT